MNKLDQLLNIPDDSDFGYFVAGDLKHPDNIKEKTKKIPFCPENKFIPKDSYKDNMKKIKPKNYKKAKKLFWDWTDLKKKLVSL